MLYYTLKKRAFTFIEILVVTAIIPVIGLAVYNCLNQGIKLWERISPALRQEDVNLFFEKIADDLRNSFQYTGLEFTGREEEISFPTLVISSSGERGVGYVNYFFDTSAHILNRKQSDYSQLYQKKSSLSRQLVKEVEFLNFQYYSYDSVSEKYWWKSVWQKEKDFPLAVRVRIKFYQGDKINESLRTISIPVAGK